MNHALDISKLGTGLGYPFENLVIGAWVKFRFAPRYGRIVDIIDDYPHEHARPCKVMLLRLDNGIFVTEQPEYLEPAKPPQLKMVKS
jgi:hypothetical protein